MPLEVKWKYVHIVLQNIISIVFMSRNTSSQHVHWANDALVHSTSQLGELTTHVCTTSINTPLIIGVVYLHVRLSIFMSRHFTTFMSTKIQKCHENCLNERKFKHDLKVCLTQADVQYRSPVSSQLLPAVSNLDFVAEIISTRSKYNFISRQNKNWPPT